MGRSNNKWKHWCPNECGKTLIADNIDRKRGLYVCSVCKGIFCRPKNDGFRSTRKFVPVNMDQGKNFELGNCVH